MQNEMLNSLSGFIFGQMLGVIGGSAWAIAALLLSCIAFILVCCVALRHDPGSTERFAAIPLSDRVEDPRDEC